MAAGDCASSVLLLDEVMELVVCVVVVVMVVLQGMEGGKRSRWDAAVRYEAHCLKHLWGHGLWMV